MATAVSASAPDHVDDREDDDPDRVDEVPVQRENVRALGVLAPDPARESEGEDDMPSHIRSALTQVSLGIPLHRGRLALGTWQGIYLFEHRDAPHRREVTLHLIGE